MSEKAQPAQAVLSNLSAMIPDLSEVPPAIFFGHGNPMNAILNNGYTEAWRLIGERLPRPKAIPSISAHWFVPEVGESSRHCEPRIF